MHGSAGVGFGAVLLAAVSAATPTYAQQPPPPVAAHALPAEGVLDTDDLIELVHRSDAVKVDQFSADPADGYDGRAFVARPLGQTSVEYDLATKALSVSVPASRLGPMSYDLDSTRRVTGVTAGQNGYGAKAQIVISRYEQIRLLGQEVRENSHPASQYDVTPLPTYRATLEPDAARELSHNLAWMVTGRLVRRPAANGKLGGVVQTEERVSLPTIANPEQSRGTVATINVVVAKEVLVDTRSGTVLLTYDVPQSR